MGGGTTKTGRRFAPTVWPPAARWAFVLALCAAAGVAFSYYWRVFYGLDAQSPFFYIPTYLPSSAVGGLMGCAVILLLKRSGALDRMLDQLKR